MAGCSPIRRSFARCRWSGSPAGTSRVPRQRSIAMRPVSDRCVPADAIRPRSYRAACLCVNPCVRCLAVCGALRRADRTHTRHYAAISHHVQVPVAIIDRAVSAYQSAFGDYTWRFPDRLLLAKTGHGRPINRRVKSGRSTLEKVAAELIWREVAAISSGRERMTHA